MPYRVELRERCHTGTRIDTPLAAERFDTLVQASRAAKTEAFHFSNALGLPIAVLIAEEGARVLIRHIVPARHDESAQPLYARHGLHTAAEDEGAARRVEARVHPLLALAAPAPHVAHATHHAPQRPSEAA